MTQISLQDVQYLAQLSSIQLDPSEAESLRFDIERILEYVAQLGELDTTDVEPTYQVTDLENVWREDVLTDQHVTREVLLSQAPEQEKDQIKVPKVL